MWQFALMAIACIPIMGFATSIEAKNLWGEDMGDTNAVDGLSSPGGIVVETLLNMRTVSALTREEQRYQDYEKALLRANANYKLDALISGLRSGLSMLIQQWTNGLQMWFGGYLLYKHPDDYEFRDFLISNFAIFLSLMGLGAAVQDITDRKEVEKSIGRIFYLLNLQSNIDPLSTDGKSLDHDDLSHKY